MLVPKLKEILKLDSAEHHDKFKGCLYILAAPRSTPIATRHDWKFISELWPLLVASKPSEKLSIVNQMNAIVDAARRTFPTIAITIEIPESCLTKAFEFGSNEPKVTLNNVEGIIETGIQNINRLNKERLEHYQNAINSLLKLTVEENL